MKTSAFLALLAATLLSPMAAHALDKPTGDVILTITGTVDNPNADGKAEFDMAMLEAIAGRTASMETPWTTGKVTFSGPFLKGVLEAAGAHGTVMNIKALNDYAIDVPFEDATSLETILATRMEDKPMSVRDKGPLFLIYPFDLKPELYNEKYFARSAWQIKEIRVSE